MCTIDVDTDLVDTASTHLEAAGTGNSSCRNSGSHRGALAGHAVDAEATAEAYKRGPAAA
ncbi:hypothetical protein [Nonomuraea sp. KM90]|uniref:hypothetical protein n=1 Tax=Nonomuraea sp. KM90 TaxID=3457428 RepID=UPI003FCCFC74